MITVMMLGGARKAFGTGSVNVDRDEVTVDELLKILDGLKAEGSDGIEPKNTLVAINGSEISAAGGMGARVRSGDVVSIIPVVHGGAGTLDRAEFEIGRQHAEAFWFGRMDEDVGERIDTMRAKFPKLAIQVLSCRRILGYSHVKKIVAVSLMARKRKLMLAKKLETDILLRFADTAQISEAIKTTGAKPGEGFVLVTVGSATQCKKLRRMVGGKIGFAAPSLSSVAKMYGITKKEDCASSGTLEDILAERAAVLF